MLKWDLRIVDCTRQQLPVGTGAKSKSSCTRLRPLPSMLVCSRTWRTVRKKATGALQVTRASWSADVHAPARQCIQKASTWRSFVQRCHNVRSFGPYMGCTDARWIFVSLALGGLDTGVSSVVSLGCITTWEIGLLLELALLAVSIAAVLKNSQARWFKIIMKTFTVEIHLCTNLASTDI